MSRMWSCRDSVVGIATRYGLDCPGIESRWGRDFPHRPDRPWVPPSIPYNGYRVSFPGLKLPGRGVDHPHSTARVKESRAIPLLPLWAFMACSGRTLPLPLPRMWSLSINLNY